MTKKILLLSSNTDRSKLFDSLLEDLNKKSFDFALWHQGKENGNLKIFQENKWPTAGCYFGPLFKDGFSAVSFLPLYPFLLLNTLFRIGRAKYKKELDVLLCVEWNEKLVATPIARLLNIKTIWLEMPGNRQCEKKLFGLYRLFSRWAKLIVFSSRTKTNLEKKGISAKHIKIIQPGIVLNRFNYQDNIFSELAHAEQPKKKFFTIGTVTDLNDQQKIEPLLQAIKKCLTVIPNCQVIIVGEGKEKKSLTWLTKKMEIEHLVWLVGEQGHLRKWLESFDLYVVTKEILNLDDFMVTLNAMSAGLPVIAGYDSGLEDIIYENKTGALLKFEDSEILAQQIIDLHQDKKLKERLSGKAKERVEKYFNCAKMLEQFEKTIES